MQLSRTVGSAMGLHSLSASARSIGLTGSRVSTPGQGKPPVIDVQKPALRGRSSTGGAGTVAADGATFFQFALRFYAKHGPVAPGSVDLIHRITDGLNEASDGTDDEYGMERLTALFLEVAPQATAARLSGFTAMRAISAGVRRNAGTA